MASPIAIDTPDYQRGVVNAQKLLGIIAAGDLSLTVGVPPNAESIVIVVGDVTQGFLVTVTGNTTGMLYVGMAWPQALAGNANGTWVFDASSPLDDAVTVRLTAPSTLPTYIYADSGVHLAADPSKLSSLLGQQYVVPTTPSTNTGDHPPTELRSAAGNALTPYNIIAAPAVGSRLRLFALAMEDNGASAASYIVNQTTGTIYLPCSAPGSASLTIPLTGLPLSPNEGLNVVSSSAGRLVAASVYYTVEFV